MEDHRLEYLNFEGIHESGTIMLWDVGVWQLHPESEDIGSCLSRGVLRFILDGEKLKGGWTLTRTERHQHDHPVWHLTKDKDDHAILGSDDLLERLPNSVLGGRSKEQIEDDWNRGKGDSDGQMRLF
jgi:bifunctional non-homologous end joining protein LigD